MSSRKTSIVVWSTASAGLFFARAFLFSTWVSRGPEVQALLNLSTAEMGVFTMLYAVGGLAGIFFASMLVKKYGSRMIAVLGFAIAVAAMMGIGFSIELGFLLVSSLLLMSIGMPMAIEDFVGNYEGNAADRKSKHSIFPAIHGAYGLGMLGGAAFSSWAIGAGVALPLHYFVAAILVGVVSVTAGLVLPDRRGEIDSGASAKKGQAKLVWSEKRSLLIAVVGFSFIMAEMSAGTWVPIALTQAGYSGSDAALLFGVFWIVITVGRLLGGFVVDAIGRSNTILISALIGSSGVAVFIAQDLINQPLLGLVLWGLGISMGFPMSIAAMGDDERMAPARINMIITVVYISSITVGPALGSVGQVYGLFVAFVIPLLFLLVAAILSPITKPETSKTAANG
ncbi:MFS_MosC_like domain containing protein [Microbacteriaceae bacterium]